MFNFRKKKKQAEAAATVKLPEIAFNQKAESADGEEPKQPLRERLNRSNDQFGGKLRQMFRMQRKLDDEMFEELETLLLMADVGAEATLSIIDNLTAKVKRNELGDVDAVLDSLEQELMALIEPCESMLTIPESDKPFVILTVGINGAGKTTTIGKMAQMYRIMGKSVMLAAGDTFRAAAVEQLKTWGERNDVPVVAQQTGADSASVVYDALQAATAKNIDVLIADTAGRLHTQSNLMEELKKIKRVMSKIDETAPHEVMLIVDGGTGQNALAQAQEFNEAIGLTGITITKLDGTARGGVLFALAKALDVPFRFIGVGEALHDLRVFRAKSFINALIEEYDNQK